MQINQKVTPFLFFDNNLEEAMDFYASIFKSVKIGRVVRYGAGAPAPEGTVMTATFELEGQQFMAFNGGPRFKFTEAISFFVSCDTQEEVDDFWEKLSEGGQKSRCGWLQDKFGLWWQIVPKILSELLYNRDPQRSQNVMTAMLKMDKMDIKTLEAAYNQ